MDEKISSAISSICTIIGGALLLYPIIDEATKKLVPEMQKLVDANNEKEMKALPERQEPMKEKEREEETETRKEPERNDEAERRYHEC